MQLDMNSITPLYIQITQCIEEDILKNILKEGERAYSQYQIAEEYNINPATAAKGLKILEQDSILYKKRGIGMFISPGARNVILEKRKKRFRTKTIIDMLKEAQSLGLKKDEIIHYIKQAEV